MLSIAEITTWSDKGQEDQAEVAPVTPYSKKRKAQALRIPKHKPTNQRKQSAQPKHARHIKDGDVVIV